MKKNAKEKIRIINGLSTILSYLSPDIINQQLFDQLQDLQNNDFETIVSIVYKNNFNNLNESTKNFYKEIINSTLNDLDDNEIDLVFDGDIYFPFENAENAEFVKGLLNVLKQNFEWI